MLDHVQLCPYYSCFGTSPLTFDQSSRVLLCCCLSSRKSNFGAPKPHARRSHDLPRAQQNTESRKAKARHSTARHPTSSIPPQFSHFLPCQHPKTSHSPLAKPKGHVLLSQTPHQCLGALASRAVLSKPCGDGGICRLRCALWGPSVMSLEVRCSSAFQRLYPLVCSKA